jgi:tetratricopeptide (TPR) repeat protein
MSALLSNPVFLLLTAFQIWMLVDAARRGEWVWFILMLVFPGFLPVIYFILVHRAAPAASEGFELPGAHRRKRIKELEAQIHHLDKAHHHLQLGDIHFQQGSFQKAEACYRAALERDQEEEDARAHLGQCLLRMTRPEEAKPLLERVCRENPKHDYGHTLMAYAETLSALGEETAAVEAWRQVLANYSYARARVQLAALLLQRQDPESARRELEEVLSDDVHAPRFQRRRDRVWIRRAKAMLRQAAS